MYISNPDESEYHLYKLADHQKTGTVITVSSLSVNHLRRFNLNAVNKKIRNCELITSKINTFM